MLNYLKYISVFSYFLKCLSAEDSLPSNVITTKLFMVWPNATIPFYINPDHFDHEQAMAIMTSLSMFAFKTCLKFAPVMTAPEESQHVMVFINPDGIRRCKMETQGHSTFHPHLVIVGYECLQSPEIDMIIMRALGFPFEHNRMSRDIYIDVMIENVEPSSIGLFTKESVLPPALRSLPYDINSVMHFGERDYSKNGHRTIVLRSPNIRQTRAGLSATDLRKIEMVYGIECRTRDRQEKIELCQSYPGVARRKREVEPPVHKSLRVNPDITPDITLAATTASSPLPQEGKQVDTEYISESLKALGIEDEAQGIIERVYKLSALALKNARAKYCNISANNSLFDFKFEKLDKGERTNSSDILGILEVIADYAKTMVDNAVGNLTEFCQSSGSIDSYQRKQCDWRTDSRCPRSYRSTKSGAVRYSTQHRPTYKQQTRHEGVFNKYSYDRPAWRAGNGTQSLVTDTLETTTPTLPSETTTATSPAVSVKRRKREVEADKAETLVLKEKKTQKEKKILKEKVKFGLKEKSEKNATKIKKKEASKEEKTLGSRRYFQERRYKVKNPKDASEGEWAESNISLDKDKEKQMLKDALDKREKEIEEDRQREREKEKLKELELEAEKLIDKKELTKDILEPLVITKETSDKSTEGDKEAEAEEDKGLEIDKEVEADKEVEVDLEIEKEKDVAIEESDTETTTEGKSIVKESEEQQNLTVDVERSKEKEEPLMKKPKQTMKQRKRSHTNLPRTVRLNKLNKEFYNERRWPDGQVIYVIKRVPEYDLEDLRNRLAEVNSILKKKTCVKLREVDAHEADGYEDYLVLDTSPDYVTGKVGGKQIFGCVELFRGGQHRQHTAMMVMAMLGFYFEVSRHDRDKHIRVHMRHVRPDKLHHFEKIRDEATLDLPYDYKSAMHPAWQFWRKIGKTGISTVATYKEHDPDGSIMRSLGQNPELFSESDIIKINSIYGVDCFMENRGIDKEKPDSSQ